MKDLGIKRCNSRCTVTTISKFLSMYCYINLSEMVYLCSVRIEDKHLRVLGRDKSFEEELKRMCPS